MLVPRSPSPSNYVKMEEVPDLPPPRKPFVMTAFELTTFQMRLMFRSLEQAQKSKSVPVTLFRRCYRRLLDMLDQQLDFDAEKFGSAKGGLELKWEDVRNAIDHKDVIPRIPLNLPQIIFFIMEDHNTSIAALLWYCIMNIGIITNIAVIILQSYTGRSQSEAELLETVLYGCVLLFVFDYCMKAFCVFFVPVAMYDEAWMLQHILPVGRQSASLASESLMPRPWSRFRYWATMPSNLVDFFSILPFFLSAVVEGLHLPLSSLRMLRLLRVMRVLRAFKAAGKWVTTLQVMGEAFSASMGSITVLVLYIVLFSMVCGAVLFQQEPAQDFSHGFEHVPAAMLYVTELFVGKSFSVSGTILSGFILAALGLFKGIIFLLPIERVKKATKESESKFDELNKLRQQVEEEDQLNKLPPGLHWATDFGCPVVRIEAFNDAMSALHSRDAGIGMLHVPLFEKEPVEVTCVVPLHGGRVRKLFGNVPTIEFELKWTPAPDTSDSLPLGELFLRVLRGSNFSGDKASRWRLSLTIPASLYGKDASLDWISPPSSSGSPDPVWAEDACKMCHIAWRLEEAPSPSAVHKSKFEDKVLGMLEDQTKRIAALESTGHTKGMADPAEQAFQKVVALLEAQTKRIADLEKEVKELKTTKKR